MNFVFIERIALYYRDLDHIRFTRTAKLIYNKLSNIKHKPIIIGLTGDLGAGKTEFVKSFFSISDHIKSPTYSIINTYKVLSESCLHADLYRLNNDISDIEMEIYEQMEHMDYVFIEWVTRSPYIYSKIDLELVISVNENEKRSINVKTNKSYINSLFTSNL